MVTSRYDMIAICEAPEEGSLARALPSVTSKGSSTLETCRAFTERSTDRVSVDSAKHRERRTGSPAGTRARFKSVGFPRQALPVSPQRLCSVPISSRSEWHLSGSAT